jgi:transcriptional regulator with XRE-family HTH domain
VPYRVLAGDFNGWLREAMAERRMTQRMLAIRAGINHSTISRLLVDGRSPSLRTALAILNVLGPESSATRGEHPVGRMREL